MVAELFNGRAGTAPATDAAPDRALWSEMAELGLLGISIPGEWGGGDGDVRDLVVVMEQAGRALAPIPLLSTLIAVATLTESGDRQAMADHLPRIADGSAMFGVVAPSFGLGSGLVTATSVDDVWELTGEVDFVLDAPACDQLLVLAQTRRGATLFVCPADSRGVDRSTRPVLDTTRPQALVGLHGVRASTVGVLGAGADAVGAAVELGRVALAAELVGLVDHALRATVEYVKTRRQFGRPIGSFQAVKHRLADVLVQLEAARSAVALAAGCAAVASEALPLAASTARVVAAQAADLAAREYVQLHGGIGFTWEHPAHLYFRRAKSASVLFGTTHDHRLRIADLLELPATKEI
jgi:acyl-CoA dehydrogenase